MAFASPSACEVLLSTQGVDLRLFLRKEAAVATGISSIVFMPCGEGKLLECGFERFDDARFLLRSMSMNTSNHAALQTAVLGPLHEASSTSASSAAAPEAAVLQVGTAPPGRSCLGCLSSELRGAAASAPSVGSRGHPDHCAPPCKFASKQKGCKDAASCSRCHLCPFTRERDREGKARQALDVFATDLLASGYISV